MNIKKDNKDYEQLYAHKFDNLDEMTTPWKTQSAKIHTRISKSEQAFIKEIKSIIKNLPNQKHNAGTDSSVLKVSRA